MDDCVSKFDWDKLLAACFIKDVSGNIYLNVGLTTYHDCADMTQVIACQTPYELADLIKAAIIIDDCGRPALRLAGYTAHN
jgi:PHP family Zn ribbon phosphoesterase